MRVTITVKPGSHRPGVFRDESTLVVAIRERAREGKANAAVVAAVATWLGIPPSRVAIVGGTSARTKRLAIEGVEEPRSRPRWPGFRASGAVPPEPTRS